MKQTIAILLVLAAAGVGIPVLADATISRRTDPIPGWRMEMVVDASVSHEPMNSVEEMTRSLFRICRLQVPVSVLEDRFSEVGEARYRFVIEPALNDSDKRQLHGSLEDMRVQHLQVDVLEIHRIS